MRLRFAPEARQDIRDILVFTLNRWGKRQQTEYRATLDAAFERIHEFPHIGNLRDDLRLGVRGHVAQSHLILYAIRDDGIRILRVIHSSIDLDTVLLP